MRLLGGASNNTVWRTYIGIDATGEGDLGHGDDGVGIITGAQGNILVPGNFIAYNQTVGVRVHGETTVGNTIEE